MSVTRTLFRKLQSEKLQSHVEFRDKIWLCPFAGFCLCDENADGVEELCSVGSFDVHVTTLSPG